MYVADETLLKLEKLIKQALDSPRLNYKSLHRYGPKHCTITNFQNFPDFIISKVVKLAKEQEILLMR
jgi:hypothetical protein